MKVVSCLHGKQIVMQFSLNRGTMHILSFEHFSQHTVRITTYRFVFLPQMQPGGLFQVNETTNVFFMILRDCFIS